MNIDDAIRHVPNYQKLLKTSPDLLCGVLDCLKEKYRTYKIISNKTLIPSETLSKYHKIVLLPKGILWKVSQEAISIGQAYQLSRLNLIEDKWFLAFYIIESSMGKPLSEAECAEVVAKVKKLNLSAKEAIQNLFGEQFNDIVPIVFPLDSNFRFLLSKISWGQQKELSDYCYEVITQAVSVESTEPSGKIVKVLRDMASHIEENGLDSLLDKIPIKKNR